MNIFLVILLSAALLITISGKKIQKCFEVIPRCPKLLSPCPNAAKCTDGSSLSVREDGCCCMPSCPENEIYLDQPHIAADPTCDLRNPFPAGAVGSLPGCFCQENFVRNKTNKCIPISECPVPSTDCGKNEYFVECGQADAFIPTCDNPDPSQTNGMAPPVCKKGCYCKPGFIRNKDWKCIKKTKCPPPQCGENEVYSLCNSNCDEPTCEHPRAYSCGYTCKKGCFCETGFVRNKDNKCIRESDCVREEL